MVCERHEPNKTVDVATLEDLLQKHFPAHVPIELKMQVVTSYAVYIAANDELCLEEGLIYLGSIASLTTLNLYQMVQIPAETVIDIMVGFEKIVTEIYGMTYLENQTDLHVLYPFRAAALATLIFNKALRGGVSLAVAFYEQYPEAESEWMERAEGILREMYKALPNPPALFLPIRAELKSYKK
jgi:hypothetical protein